MNTEHLTSGALSRRRFLTQIGSAGAVTALAGVTAAQTAPRSDRIPLRPLIESRTEIALDPSREYVLDRAVTLRSGQTIRGNGARVVMPRDAFSYTGSKCKLFHRDNAMGFRVSGGADILIENLRIEKEFENMVQTVAIWADTPQNLILRGVSCSGFSNANGVITMSGARNSTIAGCRIMNCRIVSAPARYQLTGIQFDDCRPGGRYSSGNAIYDNDIYAFDVPTFRPGNGLGQVETDGINIQGGENYHIARNRIAGMGEAIDIFCDNSLIEDNDLIDAVMIGIKVTHGASGNILSKNRISINPRDGNHLNTFGVWMVGSSNGAATDNRVLESEIDLRKAPDGAVGVMIGNAGNAGAQTARSQVIGNTVLMNDSGGQLGVCDYGEASKIRALRPSQGRGEGLQELGACRRGIHSL